jgi:hypothetical protein
MCARARARLSGGNKANQHACTHTGDESTRDGMASRVPDRKGERSGVSEMRMRCAARGIANEEVDRQVVGVSGGWLLQDTE